MKDMSVYYEDLEGTSIRDRYLLERFIKAGGSSGVYLSFDNVMNRQVAVKLLPPSDKVMGSRFEREARGLSVLSHPNTVSVYDFGKTPEGYRYMILEYLEGHTLKDIMTAERWLPPSRAIHIFSQICRALRDAHDKGIIHRDIKPSNIFLINCDGDRDFVKVLDFGVAKMLGDRPETKRADITQIGRIIGTPRYMPPEQITSQDVDARADVYTVGVVLYEMLCGSVPFLDTSLGGLLMLHLKEPPPTFSSHRSPFYEDTEAEIEVAVRKALEKQPPDRFDSIEAFREAVERAFAGKGADPNLAVSPGYIPPPFNVVRPDDVEIIQPGDLIVDAVEDDEDLEPIILDPMEETRAMPMAPPLHVSGGSPSKPPWLIPGIIGGIVVALLVGLFTLGGGNEEVEVEQPAPPIAVPEPKEEKSVPSVAPKVEKKAAEVLPVGGTEVKPGESKEGVAVEASGDELEEAQPEEGAAEKADGEVEELLVAPEVPAKPEKEKSETGKDVNQAASGKDTKKLDEATKTGSTAPASGTVEAKKEAPAAEEGEATEESLEGWLTKKKKEKKADKKNSLAAKKRKAKAKKKAAKKPTPAKKAKTKVMLVDDEAAPPAPKKKVEAAKPPPGQPAVELLD